MRKFLSLVLIGFVFGCAHNRSDQDTASAEKVDAVAQVLEHDQAGNEDEAVAKKESEEEKVRSENEPWILTGLPEREDLKKRYDTIEINLPHVDVEVHGQYKKRKGKLSVTRLKGSENCMVAVAETKETLSITDAPKQMINSIKPKKEEKNSLFPSELECHFRVVVHLNKAANLKIVAKRGAMFVGRWKSNVNIDLQWGDIDFERIRNLDVRCGNCTLTGNQVYGYVNYEMENGNVGIEGLGGTVNGSTLGDTVLKWRRVEAKSKISLNTKQGDVILSIPKRIPLSVDLSVPRGKIIARRGRKRIKNIRHSPNGIPLSVNVERGNLKLYRK